MISFSWKKISWLQKKWLSELDFASSNKVSCWISSVSFEKKVIYNFFFIERKDIIMPLSCSFYKIQGDAGFFSGSSRTVFKMSDEPSAKKNIGGMMNAKINQKSRESDQKTSFSIPWKMFHHRTPWEKRQFC